MKICYLLEDTNLSGGVRVVFDQARALSHRGHKVNVRARNGSHHWYPYPIKVDYVSGLDQSFASAAKPDVVVGTFWTTVHPALKLQAPVTVHLCQGYEGALPEYGHFRSAIEDVYQIAIPKITVGEWLSEKLIARFGPERFPAFCVGQIVDTDLYRPGAYWAHWLRHLRGLPHQVLVPGLYESFCKGVSDALEAVSIMRREGNTIHLIRVSSGQPSPQEMATTQIDEYYSVISPLEVAQLYQRADLLLAPSLSEEGFGLPFAEALASGLPAVATAIPSHLSFAVEHDYAYFVSEHDPEAMATAAMSVLTDPLTRFKFRRRGPSIVRRRFRAESVAERLESVFARLALQ